MTQDTEDVVADHSGEPVTWERLRDAHSGMLGTKEWEPWHMDAPNEGHRVYRQGSNEQCYMCAALDLIAKAEAKCQSLSDRIDVLEAERDQWRAKFKVLCDLVAPPGDRAALHQEGISG